MSTLQELLQDAETNGEITSMTALPVDVRQYLHTTVWPFLRDVVEQAIELDEALDTVIENEADILHVESAAEIAAPISIGLALCQELEKRLVPRNPADKKVQGLITEYRVKATQALATIEDITLPDDDEEDAEAPAGEAENDNEGDESADAADDAEGDDDEEADDE